MAFPLKYKGRVVILGPKSGPESGPESWPENPSSANHLRANLGPDTGQKLGLNSGRSCGRRGARFRTETSWDFGVLAVPWLGSHSTSGWFSVHLLQGRGHLPVVQLCAEQSARRTHAAARQFGRDSSLSIPGRAGRQYLPGERHLCCGQ